MEPLRSASDILIIGIGSEMRGDDAAGLLAVRALRSMNVPPSVSTAEMSGDGTSLIDLWRGFSQVILIDAVTAGLPPGSTIQMDLSGEIPSGTFFGASSHSVGIAQALAISLALDELPPSVILYGIQAGNFKVGAAPSKEVEKASQSVALSLLSELRLSPSLSSVHESLP